MQLPIDGLGGEPQMRCSKCGSFKPPEQFMWRKWESRLRDAYCRPCRAAYHRDHYQRNKQRYIAKASARTQRIVKERTEYLIAFFKEHPCADCGESDPVVLEFDHLDEKAFGIAAGMRSRNWDAVLAEMEKCEVVCANCHRRRTSRRGGFARAAIANAEIDI
ncbi:MAG: hypothetical protein QOG04_1630 [Actinomycetota bacterium]|jgi:hypothetical protein|nr:hypothetical protein [Actinomycetota bacterium]